MENYRFTLPLLPAPGKLTTVYAVDGGVARNAVLTTMATLLAQGNDAGVPVLMIDWDTESPGLHDACDRAGNCPGLLEYFAACRAQLALLNDGPGHERPGHERPGHERPGHERPGHERPGHERPEHASPGHERPALARARHLSLAIAEPSRAHDPDAPLDDSEAQRARQVCEAVDWEAFIERVDDSRPLYLMRAGCFDDTYGERAAGADWEGLFAASPSLFRCVAEHLGRRFGHVLVASRGGRSAAVSVCTSLLADRLVMLFSPSRRSLDGACGVVRRAVEYRSTHEASQRPLLVYPMPIDLDGADQGRRLRWRHGDPADPAGEAGGYQAVLEQLLRESYARHDISLDNYFDCVGLQQLNAMASMAPTADAGTLRLPLTADRFSLERGVADLLAWVADGAFPWQAKEELHLHKRIAGSRESDPEGESPAVQSRLAADLLELGALQQRQGRAQQALASVAEAATLQDRLWGAGHADTRAARLSLAAHLRRCAQPQAALAIYRDLFDEYAHGVGHGHADTLAARAGLAAALADCGQFAPALAHAEQVAQGWRERCGLQSRATLAAQAAHAALLAQSGDASRARMLFEQVLEGRERVLGAEHPDTLDTQARLAAVLRQLGHMGSARALQEQLLGSRRRLLGGDHAATIEAGLALAETAAAQCDLPAVARLYAPLAAAAKRRFGMAHPPGSSAELQMASLLAGQGGIGADPGAAASPRPAQRLAAQPHESGFAACSRGSADCGHGSADCGHGSRADDPSEIERGVIRLEQMEDRAAAEARELADRLREPVLTANVAPLVRARGVRAIVDVYFHQGDTDALIAFMLEQRPLSAR